MFLIFVGKGTFKAGKPLSGILDFQEAETLLL